MNEAGKFLQALRQASGGYPYNPFNDNKNGWQPADLSLTSTDMSRGIDMTYPQPDLKHSTKESRKRDNDFVRSLSNIMPYIAGAALPGNGFVNGYKMSAGQGTLELLPSLFGIMDATERGVSEYTDSKGNVKTKNTLSTKEGKEEQHARYVDDFYNAVNKFFPAMYIATRNQPR